ncbi:unnamed protein product [Trypanosoma congolense IL3000]|uniref:WGS project CAEQ00000000 data, annotated contig 19 n=1 Tax=Trypanosoma congolense (strain IL3000) TaxID=1068625 RepID=F9WA01_TRYCI|nr:unnamed protein product [Trypanosoma congolense IL3000]
MPTARVTSDQPPPSRLAVLVLLFMTLTPPQLTPAAAFGTKVEPGSRDCFVESVPAGATIAFLFRVTNGGSFDVDAVMTATTVPALDFHGRVSLMHTNEEFFSMRENTTTTVVNEWRRATEGSQTYTAPSVGVTHHGLPAEVTVCLDNGFSRRSPKWVEFQFLRHDAADAGKDPREGSKRAEEEVEAELHKHGSVLFELATVTERLRLVGEADQVKLASLIRIIQAGLVGNLVLLAVMAVYQHRALTRFLLRCAPEQ